jgi:hypothetical protein
VTRTDIRGEYRLVVNGGGELIVDVAREGYLPAQRKIAAGWQASATASDVVLVEPDPNATFVDLASLTEVVSAEAHADVFFSRPADGSTSAACERFTLPSRRVAGSFSASR